MVILDCWHFKLISMVLCHCQKHRSASNFFSTEESLSAPSRAKLMRPKVSANSYSHTFFSLLTHINYVSQHTSTLCRSQHWWFNYPRAPLHHINTAVNAAVKSWSLEGVEDATIIHVGLVQKITAECLADVRILIGRGRFSTLHHHHWNVIGFGIWLFNGQRFICLSR